jgi:hypothetical protein
MRFSNVDHGPGTMIVHSSGHSLENMPSSWLAEVSGWCTIQPLLSFLAATDTCFSPCPLARCAGADLVLPPACAPVHMLNNVQQIVAHLPAHLKLQLRQCSKHLQQLVDANGLQLRLAQQPVAAQAAALQLCRQQLASLDLTGLPTSTHNSSLSTSSAYAAVIQAAADGLPCLKQLTCYAAHVQLLVAVAASSPRLARIKLSSRMVLSAADKKCWSKIHQQVPGESAAEVTAKASKGCHGCGICCSAACSVLHSCRVRSTLSICRTMSAAHGVYVCFGGLQ